LDSKSDNGYIICIISSPKDKAAMIAEKIVAERLAACSQVIPSIQSFYWWQGSLMQDEEALIFLKTRAGKMRAIEELMHRIHPYEIPELVAFPISDGLPQYLKWIDEGLL
jgi:periplasmic divalent cation tolerance protein